MKLDSSALPINLPVDRGALRRDALTLFARLIRTKNVDGLQDDAGTGATGGPTLSALTHSSSDGKQKLKKCLTTQDLTSLGVGSCVGTGMYVVAGMVAKSIAGPGVIISFIIAAVASIFSGACYAEFGVRVPHTSGSAYMYSYVTVGEFIAFVIGWNMVLEYMIGTSACACALSACFDTLSNGAISRAVEGTVGTMFGRPPDFLAFGITILMTLLMAAGVRKSLLLNNVLNAANLAVWVFIMTAGLFYVDSHNWTDHKGFLPFGWSGVLTGAARCFYAFIGFDIIATTGEESTNPKKSIPMAIVSSLVIILIAYVTSSMMLTLIVPYENVDKDSALVEMFTYVGAMKCKYVVAVGALAGLTVSMFGSMFPMPRIVYAMAQDGLIFKQLGIVLPTTGTPAVATFSTGLAAALIALLIKLEVLVEMMSIGTLLAYTLVSTCVLILRYQPHSTNLIDLLPESLRTPVRGSPTKEGMVNGQVVYGNTLQPDQLKAALGVAQGTQSQPSPSPTPMPAQSQQRVMVRRVTRRYSSPDSDDTYPGEDQEDEFSRDDQFLVSDKSENKFYGSTHGGTSGGGPLGGLGLGSGPMAGVASAVGPSLGYLGRRLQAATYLCPAIFPWVDSGPATEESGMFVMKMVGVLYLFIVIFDLIIVCGMGTMGSATTFFLFLFFFAIVAVLLIISRKPQNRKTLLFTTPGLPFIPAIAVTVNIYLIFKLSYLTLVRFLIWMSLGFAMYFMYGIKNSVLEEAAAMDADEPNIELAVTGAQPSPSPSPSTTSTSAPSASRPSAAPSQGRPPPPPPPSRPAPPPPSSASPSVSGGSSLFVSTTNFPTWDD